MIVLPCKCGKSWKAPQGAQPGSQIACPACKNMLVVPGPSGDGLRDLQTKVQDLERMNAESKELLRQKELEARELSARLAELEAEARSAAEVPLLRQQLRQAVAERESLNAVVAKQREDHAKEMESAEAESAARLRELGAKEEASQARRTALEKELADARLRITENERELHDLESALEEWRGKEKALEQRLAETEATRIRDRETAIRSRERDESALREENRRLQKEIVGLQGLSEGLRVEVLKLQEHQALAESRLRGNEAARKIAVQTRSLIADLEGELGGVAASLARMHDRIQRTLGSLTIPEDPIVEVEEPGTIAVPLTPVPPEAQPMVEAEAVEEVAESREFTGRVIEPTPVEGIPAVPTMEEVPPAEEATAPPEESSSGMPAWLSEGDEPVQTSVAPPAETEDPIPLIDRGEEPSEEALVEETVSVAEESPAEVPAEGEAELQEAEEQPEPPKKRGFLSRLFGKK